MSESLTIEKLRVMQAQISELSVPRIEFIESPHLTITTEDWSQVRSPSRAERRRKQGHRQRIRTIITPDPKFYRFGGTIAAHPETIRKLRAVMAERVNSTAERMMFGAIYGDPRP